MKTDEEKHTEIILNLKSMLPFYTEDKKNKRAEMVQIAMKVKGAVQSLATDEEDGELFYSVDYKECELLNGNTLRAKAACMFIYKKTKNIINTLENYGIDMEDLEKLERAIAGFSEVMNLPRIKRRELKEERKRKLADCSGRKQ